MNDGILRAFFVVTLLLALAFAGCGGEDEHSEEEMFDTYGECWEHALEEGGTATFAFNECDMQFEAMHTDLDGCRAYYADFAGIPMDAVEAWCTEMFPAM